MNGPNSALGYIVKVHPSSGVELSRSSVNTINNRAVLITNNRIIAIAGQNRGGDAIRLVEISPDTLQMVNRGNDDIHQESLLWVKGTDIYALVSSGGNLYIARFDLDLTMQAQSSVAIHPFATITFQDSILLTQRSDGRVLILDATDLSEGR
jgi:hypothetical protein